MLPKFRSFVRSIVHRSFIVPIHHSSFVHSSYSSFIVRSWSLFIVLPDNLCPAVMLPKFRSFVHPIIRSFVRSFIVPIHCSSFVHTNYSLSLFTITIHRYYSHTLFIVVTIYRYYSSSLLFIDDIYNFFSIATNHRYYSSVI
jgi:hypothetical protein